MAKNPTAQAAVQINTVRGTAMPAWTPYLALFIGDPAAGGFEVSGGAYARQAVVFGAPASGQSQNTNTLTYPTPTADWGIVTHLVLMDAPTGGTWRMSYLASGSDVQRTVTSGSPPITILPGNVVYGEP
jgi:hypothetical protein